MRWVLIIAIQEGVNKFLLLHHRGLSSISQTSQAKRRLKTGIVHSSRGSFLITVLDAAAQCMSTPCQRAYAILARSVPVKAGQWRSMSERKMR
jgi:stalled ribosome rescue protein Dom34